MSDIGKEEQVAPEIDFEKLSEKVISELDHYVEELRAVLQAHGVTNVVKASDFLNQEKKSKTVEKPALPEREFLSHHFTTIYHPAGPGLWTEYKFGEMLGTTGLEQNYWSSPRGSERHRSWQLAKIITTKLANSGVKTGFPDGRVLFKNENGIYLLDLSHPSGWGPKPPFTLNKQVL